MKKRGFQFDMSFCFPHESPTGAPTINFVFDAHYERAFFDILAKHVEYIRPEFAEKYIGRTTQYYTNQVIQDLFDFLFGYERVAMAYPNSDCSRLIIGVHGCAHLRKHACLMMHETCDVLNYMIYAGDSDFDFKRIPIQLNTRTAHEQHGHSVGGHIGGHVHEWVAKIACGTDAHLIQNAMRTMGTHIGVNPYNLEHHPRVWFENGRFSLNCHGNACDLSVYPEGKRERHSEISCHNLDTSEQQLMLLAGFAMICRRANEWRDALQTTQ